MTQVSMSWMMRLMIAVSVATVAGCVEVAPELPGGDIPDGSLAEAASGCMNDDECPLGQSCHTGDDGIAMCVPEAVESACDGGCPPAMQCVDGECVPGSMCGVSSAAAELGGGDIQLVLDRSCSMNARLPPDESGVRNTKWEATVNALANEENGILRGDSGDLRWGLTLFPRPLPWREDGRGPQADWNGEEEAPLEIPISGDGAADIAERLLASLDPMADVPDKWVPGAPTCQTPTLVGLRRALRDSALGDDAESPRHLVLVTDGMPTNGTRWGNVSDIESFIQERCEEGVSTHVVGFGTGVRPENLNRWAQVGCAPRLELPADAPDGFCQRQFREEGEACYYQANTAADLEEALAAIAGRILDCTIEVDFGDDQPLLCPESLQVFAGREPISSEQVAYDEMTGTITLSDEACALAQGAGELSVVQPDTCCIQ